MNFLKKNLAFQGFQFIYLPKSVTLIHCTLLDVD